MTIDHLLQPVSAEAPCGEDLSFSLDFDAVQEMRREDDPTLDQGEWVTALKTADWPGVAATCEQLLLARSKDLRVAAWLAEAWAHTRRFEGLADGLRLTAQLCARHWEQLHPLPEGGDHEQRIGNLAWLLARVEALARGVPLLRPRSARSACATSTAHVFGPRAKRRKARHRRAIWRGCSATRRASCWRPT